MYNPYKRLLALIGDPPLQVGVVQFYSNGVASIELPGGGIESARGEAAVNDKVFFRNGVIEGPAPDLTIEIIEL